MLRCTSSAAAVRMWGRCTSSRLSLQAAAAAVSVGSLRRVGTINIDVERRSGGYRQPRPAPPPPPEQPPKQSSDAEAQKARDSATADGSVGGDEDGQDAKKASADASSSGAALQKPVEVPVTRNMIVFSNTTKAVYIHYANHIASWYWFKTDFHPYFALAAVLFVGSQMFVRYRTAKVATAQQARLGETLLDQRTRDLLTDIEHLRAKDPMRLEHEANAFHDAFWTRRAKAMSEANHERRNIEIQRGLMQGEARGTDMTEWLGAKQKDEDERQVARRTHDYIQGFHQHLKARRLI